MIKKLMALFPIILLALLLMAADNPTRTIRFTIINKADTDIAIQLQGKTHPCCNKADVDRGEFYYLPVAEGSKEKPMIKQFDIEANMYDMRLFYISTYDPVYGYKCDPTVPNQLLAARNLRLVVLPCNELPGAFPKRQIGEPSMWKYLPFPVKELAIPFTNYWKTRLIY